MLSDSSGFEQNGQVLAIIPARGGSKGLPGKNIADLGGVPLVAHSIMAARSCPLIDRTVVSTDSEEIADIARKWGAEVPFMRPDSFAGDTSPVGEAIQFTLNELFRREQYFPRCVAVLFPSHPFRTQAMMNELTGKLLEGYSPVRTVKKVVVGALTHMIPGEKNIHSLHDSSVPASCYRSYGLFSGFWNKWVGSAKKTYSYELKSEAELVDIDTEADLVHAREIVAGRRFVTEWT